MATAPILSGVVANNTGPYTIYSTGTGTAGNIYYYAYPNFDYKIYGTESNVTCNTPMQYIYLDYTNAASQTQTVTGLGNGSWYVDPSLYAWANINYAPETAEQRIAREEHQLKEKVRMEAAASRAEQLLFACISEEQAKEYLEKGYFETKVSDKRYRIKKGRSGNVFQLDDKGREVYRYCAHPHMYVPDQDTMLAQLLMLHSDERKFLATANRTILHP